MCGTTHTKEGVCVEQHIPRRVHGGACSPRPPSSTHIHPRMPKALGYQGTGARAAQLTSRGWNTSSSLRSEMEEWRTLMPT